MSLPEVASEPANETQQLTVPVQKILRDLKSKISTQSKKNFVLEKDVRYLDSRIALLIQNRMALEEVCLIFASSRLRAYDADAA